MVNASPAALMFDLDGTLVDTMPRFADLAASIMHRVHGDDPARARARYLETSGIPFRHQLEVLWPRHAANDEASSEFERRKRSICVETPMNADTVAALEALRGRGLRLVVSSNTGQEFVDEFSRREAFRFDLALGFDAASGLAKGRPHVERVRESLGVEPQDLWFVGDSLKDGDLARDCGVTFVGRLGTFDARDFERRFQGVRTIRRIADLLDLVACRR